MPSAILAANYQPRLVESLQSSNLPSTVELAYQDRHTLGFGYDLVTNQIAVRGVEPFELVTPGEMKSAMDIRSVTNENEMLQELQLNVKGDYNFDGTSIGLTAEYLNRIASSSNSISLIAAYESRHPGYSLAKDGIYVVTQEAADYFAEHGEEKFQQRYGQYFIAGYKYGAKFYAVYCCTATEIERFDEFKAELSVSTPELFSAEGSVEFSRLAKEKGVAIEASVPMVGYPKGTKPPPLVNLTPAEVLERMDWFLEHETGVPIETYFMSYANVLVDFVNSININPGLLTRLRLTYKNYWLIKYFHRSMPAYYQEHYRTLYDDFTTEMEVRQSEFMRDGNLVDSFFYRSEMILQLYRDILRREALYYRVVKSLDDVPEPKKDKEIDEDKKNATMYGVTIFTSDELDDNEIDCVIFNIKKDYSFGDWKQKKNKEWQDGDAVILGWEVRSKKDNNGFWCKKLDGDFCLSSRFWLYMESNTTRGINYEISIWYIDKSLFRFGKVAVQEDQE